MPAPFERLRVLLVDDFATMRRILRNALSEMGVAHIDEASGGREAMALLERGCYDLIVSDWNMPDVNGLELLQWVRSQERLANLPFLMVTAESNKENILAAVKAQVNQYLVKPFTGQALRDKIERMLRDRYQAA